MNSADSLGDRMKSYEAQSTSRSLMPNVPVYARIDGRAFHTFCRGLEKPFSKEFIGCMKEVAKRLVADFGAILGYVESDEISLGWESPMKAPFDGRVQKLESVLASAASAYMNMAIFGTDAYPRLKARAEKHPPTFDCRCFSVPDMEELANAFLWRENDAIKNSCTGMALHFFSHSELQGRDTAEKVHMMRMRGYCFYDDTDESFLRGTFFKRRTYEKELSAEELSRIPPAHRPGPGADGKTRAVRSEVAELKIPYRLTDIACKTGVLFLGAEAVLNKAVPTFDFSGRPGYSAEESDES